MRKILPHPILTALLLGLWLMLQQSAGLGHVLLGGAVAILVSLAASRVVPGPVSFKRPLKFLWFLALAGIDIIASNLAVLWVLLQPRPRPRGGFVEMKLELTDPFGLAVLACLITATPGSAWLEHRRETSSVIIHVFDLEDGEAWVAGVKTRYESLLLEIFQ